MMNKNKWYNLIVLFSLLTMALSGCFRNEPVESYEMGLIMVDGVSIDRVVGPGLHSDGSWRAEIYTVNVSNITTTWQDPSLVTRDKQPIGLTLSVTFARNRNSESIKELYNRYNAEAINDDALKNLVLSKVPGVAKTITTQYTLDQMLGLTVVTSTTVGSDAGREVTTQKITELLTTELTKIYVDLVAVEIVDITPSVEFMASLNAKAQASINMEVANQQTKLITEQLAQEEAQTKIELEKARRENLVNAEMAKAYEESPQLLELRKLELLGDVLGAGDTVIYVPEGSDITSVLTQVPVVPTE